MKKSKKKQDILFIVAIVTMLLVAVGFFLYPTVSNWVSVINDKDRITTYAETVSTLSDEQIEDYFGLAREYNKRLSTNIVSGDEDFYSSYDYYNEILNFGDGMIGSINIPSINVNLPIYHSVSNTNDDMLEMGAVHRKESSFPIGGESTHSVISAHTAYPTRKFFSDIDELVVGDVFYISVVNQVLKYEVCDSKVLKPSEVSANIKIEQGEDYVTLVTCYPYAINTHRLLVKGRRVEYNPETDDEIISDDNVGAEYIVPLIIILSALLIGIVIVVCVNIKRRKAE